MLAPPSTLECCPCQSPHPHAKPFFPMPNTLFPHQAYCSYADPLPSPSPCRPCMSVVPSWAWWAAAWMWAGGLGRLGGWAVGHTRQGTLLLSLPYSAASLHARSLKAASLHNKISIMFPHPWCLTSSFMGAKYLFRPVFLGNQKYSCVLQCCLGVQRGHHWAGH